MSDLGSSTVVDGRGRQDEKLTELDALLGKLYFNNALTRIKQGDLSGAQAQLESARDLLPIPLKVELIFLQAKVAVLEGDSSGVGRYLDMLGTTDLTVEQEKQLGWFRQLVIEVDRFRVVLPLYAVVDRTLRLIGAVCFLVSKILWRISLTIGFVVKKLARGIRKGSVALNGGLCWAGSSIRLFVKKVSRSLVKKGDSSVEEETGGDESGEVCTDVEVDHAVDDSLELRRTNDVVCAQPVDAVPETIDAAGTESGLQPVSDPEPGSEADADTGSPQAAPHSQDDDGSTSGGLETECSPDQSGPETSTNT